MGRKDGAKAIQIGEDWFESRIEMYRESPSLQKEYLTFGDFIAVENLKAHSIGNDEVDVKTEVEKEAEFI